MKGATRQVIPGKDLNKIEDNYDRAQEETYYMEKLMPVKGRISSGSLKSNSFIIYPKIGHAPQNRLMEQIRL